MKVLKLKILPGRINIKLIWLIPVENIELKKFLGLDKLEDGI